jgi:hypothetical protein
MFGDEKRKEKRILSQAFLSTKRIDTRKVPHAPKSHQALFKE